MDKPSKSILFFTPFGYWQVHNQLDLAVAWAARDRGLRTTYVTCDAFYQPCAMERGQIDCESCQDSMRELASPFSIAGESLGALMDRDEIARADGWVRSLDDDALVTAAYEDLKVGEWALSNVMTHFRVGNLADLNRPDIVGLHRRFLRDTLLTYWTIGRVIDRDRIDAMFLFNGRFYAYRAALEAARHRNVRVLVHERGRVANSFGFFENESCLSPKTAEDNVAAWAGQPLDEHQMRQVDEHFSQLLRGRSPSWPSFYDQLRSGDPHEVLDIPAGATIVGFFTSSSDEIATQTAFAKAMTQFALIEEIAAILDEAGVYLIVRHHPHIGGGPVGSPVETSAFFEAYFRARTRRGNVRVVMPKDDLTSYAIFPYLHAAIAPFTSLGLEATAFGIPTLTSQGSISSFDRRYTIDDWSVPALKAKIGFVLSADAALDGERLRKFYRTFYSRFHRFSIRFDAVSIADYIQPSLRQDFMDALQPGRDEALDRVMTFLVHGKHVHERPEPGTPPSDTTSAAEDAYIAGRLAEIAERSDSRRQAAAVPVRGRSGLAILCEAPEEDSAIAAYLAGLPNADLVSIVPFRPIDAGDWRKRISLSRKSRQALAFRAWAHGLREALRGIEDDRVIVLSGRHQLHDASIATIVAAAQTPSPSHQMTILSGWFAVAGQARPLRASASTLTLPDWQQMRRESSGDLRAQDLLALAAVDKAWLCGNLKSASRLEHAFFKAANASNSDSPSHPVFLWQ